LYSKPESTSRSFWDKFASDYDDHQLNDNYKKLIERIVGDVGKTEKVLDAACGTAIISFAIFKNVQHIEAIDYSAEMVSIAQQKAITNNISNVNFSVQSVSDLSFPKEHFDSVIVCNSLHVIERMKEALSELHRVLKRGGKLIAPNACLGESNTSKEKTTEMVSKGFPAYNVFSADEYCKMIEVSGFQITKRQPVKYRMPMEYVVAYKK
jgi:ubiquinone/menaquinone biosynthesis C-methylase UbiE